MNLSLMMSAERRRPTCDAGPARTFGGSAKRTPVKDRQSILARNNLDEWARLPGVGTESSGSSAIMGQDTSTLMMRRSDFLGRLDIERMRGIEGWMPGRKLIKVIEELKSEGRL